MSYFIARKSSDFEQSGEIFKQWPLAPNLPKWRITRANVSNASLILANAGECIEC